MEDRKESRLLVHLRNGRAYSAWKRDPREEWRDCHERIGQRELAGRIVAECDLHLVGAWNGRTLLYGASPGKGSYSYREIAIAAGAGEDG